ncbi:Terpene synthase family, metal binding domain [Micromonospora sediminicola]|uniref:Terpene synthase n=1 Tax=Micromonospora sediminicola TaxID=946078 RepID=A0A1A9B760_9ACTN|nr:MULTISPECIES: terpene synthase [Micromonospora]PGH40892.1 terpene synthase [Micromonospora sp. WMMA1996]SBT65355.1 Terpene synthase family, metal binding domain [Micromonospora sediminicola]
MRGFALSALHEPPFPARRHPDVERIARESAGWVGDLGLVDDPAGRRRLAGAHAAELAGRASPQASPDGLRLLTDLINWLFVMDDACDDDGLGADPTRLAPTVAALLAVLDRHGDPDAPAPSDAGPLAVALDDLCRRVRGQRQPALLLRLVSQLREYLLALLWEAANREHRRVPGVAEYTQMRRHTGGVRPSFTVTDLARTPRTGAAQRSEPALAALDALATDLVCWCNDLFSYGKERGVAPEAHNLVTTIAGENGQDEPAALRAAAARFNTALATYAERDAALAGAADDGVRAFLDTRRDWIRATYDWSRAAARYT